MKKHFISITLLLACLFSCVSAKEEEAYTRVLDSLTGIHHFAKRPVLFIIGFDTSKSMSVEFDRSKKLTQTILSRYSAPGDSVFVFGFADKPSVLEATKEPRLISRDKPDSQIASINEGLLSLPRSKAKGTVFGRAKLFALEKMAELGRNKNVVVLLFSDNNSEIEMGTNERERLQSLERSVATNSETMPLSSQGVAPLWLTLYTNSFSHKVPLAGPDGQTNLDNPRLAWAARRVGSQTLQFVSPASPRIESNNFEVTVQFLGSSEPKSATLTVDGQEQQHSAFREGRASWELSDLEPGSHLLLVQAVLADGKVRTQEMQIQQQAVREPTTLPSPQPTKSEPETPENSSFPFLPVIILAALGAGVYFLSLKPVRVRVIGPDSEESFLIPKGKSLRIGGKPRVESDLVFLEGDLKETIASIRCLSFGKPKIFLDHNLREGSIEGETDEGYSVGESGEPLSTSATLIFSSERGHKKVFTLVKEDASGARAEESEHFGASSRSGEEASTDGGDWRS